MPKTKALRWTKAAVGEYQGRFADGRFTDDRREAVVAVCARTGSHLDDYPWDWYLTDFGVKHVPPGPMPCTFGSKCQHPPKIHARRHAGVEDTLRAAKLSVEATLAPPGDATVAA